MSWTVLPRMCSFILSSILALSIVLWSLCRWPRSCLDDLVQWPHCLDASPLISWVVVLLISYSFMRIFVCILLGLMIHKYIFLISDLHRNYLSKVKFSQNTSHLTSLKFHSVLFLSIVNLAQLSFTSVFIVNYWWLNLQFLLKM